MVTQPVAAPSPAPVPPVNSALCRSLAACTAASAAALVLISAALWIIPAWAPFMARSASGLQTEPITLTPAIRWMGLTCTTLHLGVLAWGLWAVRTLFGRLADGLVFEPQTGVLLRRFGIALLVYAGLSPVVGTTVTWLVTMKNVSGERLLRFGLSDHEVLLAIVGALVLTIGSVMAEAARLADDNRQIV
jgi:hypothetical protein